MIVKGKVFKYGENIDTDVIIPARYLNTFDATELAKHCMEDIDKSFSSTVTKGDIIIASKNFGCGSSREHAPLAIKSSGISCIIASSFARIFYRNAINIGLPILECPHVYEDAEKGDIIEVDFNEGIIRNISKDISYKAFPFPPFIQNIIENGGLMNSLI